MGLMEMFDFQSDIDHALRFLSLFSLKKFIFSRTGQHLSLIFAMI